MEQTHHNGQVMGKRMWSVVRVVFFMLRKGICKRKLIVDLNTMLKRGKLAGGRVLNNLIHHHHSPAAGPREYEFSCSNTPMYTFPGFFHHKSRKSGGGGGGGNLLFGCAHAPSTLDDCVNDAAAVNAVKAVLEMLNSHDQVVVEAAYSPALPGFGRSMSPFVRPLRITDSPFPLKDVDEGDNGYVDKAAEEFIQKFYKELKKQKRMADH